jgi:hypothetical protein
VVAVEQIILLVIQAELVELEVVVKVDLAVILLPVFQVAD